MKLAYWIIAGLLAFVYSYSGVIKVIRSKDQLRSMMAWIDDIPLPLTRTVGVLEVLGAIGLILPPLTGIVPGLALAAAIGLVLVQVGAIAVHLRRGEVKVLGLNLGLAILAAVEVWLSTAWI